MRCRRWRPASAGPPAGPCVAAGRHLGAGGWGSAGSPHGFRRAVISPCRRGYRAGIVTLPPVSGLRRWVPALAPMARRVTPPLAWRSGGALARGRWRGDDLVRAAGCSIWFRVWCRDRTDLAADEQGEPAVTFDGSRPSIARVYDVML